MGLFDFFKKKEVVVNNPIVETKNDDPIKKGDISIEGNKEQIIIKVENPEKKIVTSNEAALESMGFSSIFLIKGLRDDVASSEIVDFIEHDEISEEAKKLTIDTTISEA